MADATFKDLCRDAGDPLELATFWAQATGRHVVRVGGGGWRVVTDVDPDRTDPARSEWVDPVPEPKTAKTRVHLDLRLPEADPAPLVHAGARVLSEPGDGISWWVLADPEGNEFCAMPPAPPEWDLEPVAVPTPFELVVDSADPERIARWWAARTHGRASGSSTHPWWWVEGAAGFPYRYWVFTPVPEPKTVKNRVHWDVTLDRDDPSALLAAGAALLREPDDEITWWVLADPEGNEFCAFRPGDA
jgi:hypothetical protein